MCHSFGSGPSVVIGLKAAITALIGWFMYHLIIRRNDGMAAFIIGAVIPSSALKEGRPPSFLFLLLFQVAIHMALAIFARYQAQRTAPKPEASAGGPLYDGQLDGP